MSDCTCTRRSTTRWLTVALLTSVLVACSGGGSNSVGGSGDANVSANGVADDAPDGALEPIDSLAFADDPIESQTRTNPWYQDGETAVSRTPGMASESGAARNIILFIGDGMSLATITAARILEGQRRGNSGEESSLSFESMERSGLIKTYTVDAQTPDSAGTMTAIMTGVKTRSGILGVDSTTVRGDCPSQRGRELVTVFELAELAGKHTGIVSTGRLTDATAAAAYAKSVERAWEDDSDLPLEARADGCVDIARQLINVEPGLEARYPGADVDGPDVLMGGGRRHFLPADAQFNSNDSRLPVEGRRSDGQHLIDQWQRQYPLGQYIVDQSGFDGLDANRSLPVLALFSESHMQYEADRDNDIAGEPSLAEMTETAIDLLDRDDTGFLLVVEAARIEHAHQAGNAYAALNETIELSDAVQRALDRTDPSDTLILVTADHAHPFTMGGFARRGNPILGPVIGIGSTTPRLASDGLPFTTLGYANGRGFHLASDNGTNPDNRYDADVIAGRQDLGGIDTQSPGFHQEVLVPLESQTASGEDVTIYARGPGSVLVSGTQEQHSLFHLMNHAGNLQGLADQRLATGN